MAAGNVILALNSGSSSIKFSLFRASAGESEKLYDGAVDGIGGSQSAFRIADGQGKRVVDDKTAVPNREAAFRLIRDALTKPPLPYPEAIGHRIVSGGPKLTRHQRITPQVVAEMEAHTAFAPLHTPIAIYIIRKAEEMFPGLPNVAIFDTAFHTTIPETAARFAIPDRYWKEGVRRYGAHGISYESILYQLAWPQYGGVIPRRMIVMHLGNGASIAAIRDGHSIDTSMGLTPTGGLVSATRTGDIDPGVLLYLLRGLDDRDSDAHKAAEQLEKLVDKESGLLGVSGVSNDMRALREAIGKGDRNAAAAVDVFAYAIRKFVGSYVAVLGGLDALVFTGGIGEHDAQTRLEICSGLEHFGIALDGEKNKAHDAVISTESAAVTVRIVPAAEDLMIALHTQRILAETA